MSKKITKIIGIIFAVLAAVSLAFPIYETTFTDGESMTLLLRGYDLYEFSAWGVVTILIPLLIVGIMLAKFDDRIKSALIMGTFIFGNVSVHSAKNAMREWIYGEATDMVYPFTGLFFYVVFLFCSSAFCYVYCIMKTSGSKTATIDDFREYLDEENLSLDATDMFDKDYLLLGRSCKVVRNERYNAVTEFDANMLFGISNGFFITDARDDCKDDEIEIDGETAGFAYKDTLSGLINIFYEDIDLTPYEKVKLMPECEISNGEAELICNDRKTKVNLFVDNECITATVCDNSVDANELCGGVILQNGKLATVVTYYDEKRKVLICENAEKYAKELNKAAYEQKVFDIANGFKEFLKKGE